MTSDHTVEAPQELHSSLAPLSIHGLADESSSSPQRPKLQTSTTMPVTPSPHFGGMNLEHNAWAEDDDDDDDDDDITKERDEDDF